MLDCIIIDDNQASIDVVSKYVGRSRDLNLKKTFIDPVEGLSYLDGHVVDLIFLDQDMPDLNGLDFVRILQEKNSIPPKIIFTSGHIECAVQTYDYMNVIGFLEKPVSLDRFLKSIQRAMKLKADASDCFLIESQMNSKKETYRIKFDEILWVEVDRMYVTFRTENKENDKVTMRLPLKEIESRLPTQRFFRVHNSFIVNLSKIVLIQPSKLQVKLCNDDVVKISKANYKALVNQLNHEIIRDTRRT